MRRPDGGRSDKKVPGEITGIFPKPGGPDPIPVMKKIGGR